MTRTKLLAITAAALIALTACGGDDGGDTGSGGDGGGDGGTANQGFTPPDLKALTELGEPEGEVNIVAWAGYVEDGSTDPSVDWVTPFEEETGCQVNVKTAPTSDDMVNLMKTGQYDVVSASGDASLRLIASGDVEPVNTDLVPNYVDIFEALKMKPWNSVDGVAYGIPHGRGANLLMYNTDEVSPAPDSWSAVFDDASANAGKVTAYDSPIYIADAAVYLMATQPDLGIENPYALDDKQFQAAVDLLKEQNANIGEYWSDYTKEIQAFKNGDSVVGTTWQIIVNLAQADKAKVEAVLPKEGATGWSDTWMVATKSEHKNCAYMWLDHIVSPTANAQVAEWFGEAPCQPEVVRRDGRPEALRHLPRGRRGLLRPGLVLDHADHPVPRRPHRRPVQGLRRLDHGLAGDQGLARRDRPAGGPAAVALAAAVGRPAPAPGAAAVPAARGTDARARRRLPRRARRAARVGLLDDRRLHRRGRAPGNARQLPVDLHDRRLPHRHSAHRSASRPRSPWSARCSPSRWRSSWRRSPRRAPDASWSC